MKNNIENFKKDRDRLDLNCSSHLSPHLHFGEISPKLIWKSLEDKCKDIALVPKRSNGLDAFFFQFGCREFFHHLFHHFPNLPNQNYKSEFDTLKWSENKEHLKAWKRGNTGYPIVDAGMNELWTTGWISNRMRLIVGSFLVKTLFIDWKEGEKWFWDTLVDADLANNSSGWQWIGGTGTDGAKHIRVFNPIIQSKKCDPNGDYIRKWIPSLKKLTDEYIHEPWNASEEVLLNANIELGRNYPYPIVDHTLESKKSIDNFNNVIKN